MNIKGLMLLETQIIDMTIRKTMMNEVKTSE